MLDIEYDFFKNRKINYFVQDIYHYTSPEGLKGILENNSLHFTHSYFLNDKSELIYTYKLLLKILPSLKEQINQHLYDAIQNRAEDVTDSNFLISESETLFKEDFYIASFSKEDDSLPLWNNYTKTDNKIGFNLKFNAEKLVQNIKTNYANSFVAGSLVCYDEGKQIMALKDCIINTNEKIKNGVDINEAEKELIHNFIVYSLFLKHSKFSIEKEYRIIVGNKSHIEDSQLEFKIKNGTFIPYLEIKLPDKKDVDNRIIEQIGISPTANSELIQYSLKKLLNKTGYLSMQLQPSSITLRF